MINKINRFKYNFKYDLNIILYNFMQKIRLLYDKDDILYLAQ